MKALHVIAFILVIVGALNWLLIGAFELNVVAYLGLVVSRIIYIIVGLSAVYLLVTHKKQCAACKSDTPAAM